jgi:hypothetical protein
MKSTPGHGETYDEAINVHRADIRLRTNSSRHPRSIPSRRRPILSAYASAIHRCNVAMQMRLAGSAFAEKE